MSLPVCADNEKYEQFAASILERVKFNDWQAIYDCRMENFKALYSFEIYRASMAEAYHEYGLVNYELGKVRVLNEKYVGVKFRYSIKLFGNVVSVDDEMVLIDEGKELICVDVGLSTFYPLNGRVVIDSE